MVATGLRTHGLACVRGGRDLFRAVDIDVSAGEALWVQGRNGSGKTSLLRLLCGLALPSAGAVHWLGRDVRDLREDFYRDLLYIGHAGGIKDDLTAAENLLLGARIAGQAVEDQQAQQALAQVGLAAVSRLPAARLSQGQRKRVALARLHLARRPPLLVLDEPFNALDQAAADGLQAALNQHLAQGGMVVYTTHQPLALQAARLHVLELGPAQPC
ncbi:cytochrome c biogenesis heme-transporting ATPase CcmA [Polaromonas hydrogenivorans]|uniref:Cytochrome c biogenesis heme-transporting ATPase CcmA n=1 Tax=Polaromonas hydrogenivorans TaxID=335476 RepID=A0AAU7LTE0_9BURK